MTQLDPDYEDLTDDEEELGDGSSPNAALRKKLKAETRARKEAEARAEANASAARRVAFLDADIPDTPQARYFRETYNGSLDKDAIREAALTNGFLTEDDTSAEIKAIESDTAAFVGGAQPTDLSHMDEFQAEVAKAVAKAPRGQENQVIAEVMRRFQGQV